MMLLSGLLWIWVAPLLAETGGSLPIEMPIDVSTELAWLVRMGPNAGGLFLLFGALKAVSGYGLLKLRAWGRRLTIALAGFTLLLTLPGFVSSLFRSRPAELIVNLVFAGCYGLILWYLFTPRVKQAFAT